LFKESLWCNLMTAIFGSGVLSLFCLSSISHYFRFETRTLFLYDLLIDHKNSLSFWISIHFPCFEKLKVSLFFIMHQNSKMSSHIFSFVATIRSMPMACHLLMSVFPIYVQNAFQITYFFWIWVRFCLPLTFSLSVFTSSNCQLRLTHAV